MVPIETFLLALRRRLVNNLKRLSLVVTSLCLLLFASSTEFVLGDNTGHAQAGTIEETCEQMVSNLDTQIVTNEKINIQELSNFTYDQYEVWSKTTNENLVYKCDAGAGIENNIQHIFEESVKEIVDTYAGQFTEYEERKIPEITNESYLLLGKETTDQSVFIAMNNLSETQDEYSEIMSFSVGECKGNEYSDDELDVLYRIVEAEATGEDIVGKILVANVILNRVNHESFPDTIREVVFQKAGGCYQFSPISDKRFWTVKVTEETKEAVIRAVSGEDYSRGALYFMCRKRTRKARWFDTHLKRLFEHGGHEFYTSLD